ncbi:site-specific integrase [Clostridium sp.]|uniref:tyrosine-type recombinase/integrase n=1 Tax=Clostridium sp. TaxID=1506 RepID=UPI002636F069|nr:site-specific integrase [Clostridium sp.]
MRLPNGYGTVYKLSGKRRKPFIARKTNGWNDEGKQLYITIGYYETKKQALQALSDFNTNPFNIEVSTITFSEVFEKWSVQKYTDITRSAINGYNAAYDASKVLHDMRFVDVKTMYMQDVITNSSKGYATLRKIKSLYNQLFKYAMENDIVTKDYSDYVNIGKRKDSTTRKPFTDKEIKRLFDVENSIPYVDTILIMIFTGLRIGELLILKPADIDLKAETIIGGIKTDAGKDRVIPINHKILPFIKKRLSLENEYLIVNDLGRKMKYDNYYREKFTPIMEQLNMNHKPHDCRHTFATLMSNSDANKTAIKKIIGHSSYITTEKIYTHKDIEELRKAIELI